jgi:MFS family permease
VVTRPFVSVWLTGFGSLLAMGMLLPVLPLYATSLGAGNAAVGVAVAATTPAAALLQPFVGRLADRRGRRPLLVLGPFLYGLSVVALTTIDSVTGLIAVRALAGVAEAAIFTSTATVANDLAPVGRRGEAMSLYSIATWAGLALGPVLGELVLDDTAFGRVWVMAAVIAAAAGLAGLTVPETRPATPPAGCVRLLSRAAAIPGLVMIAAMAGFAGVTAFLPLHVRDLGLDGAGTAFGVYAATVITIRLLGRKLPDRVGARRAALVAVALAATGLLLIAAAPSALVLYAGMAVLGAGSALTFPSLMMLVVAGAAESERSAAVGTFSACAEVGYALGAVGLGLVADGAGYAAVFLVAAAVVLAGALPLRHVRVPTPDPLAASTEPAG